MNMDDELTMRGLPPREFIQESAQSRAIAERAEGRPLVAAIERELATG